MLTPEQLDDCPLCGGTGEVQITPYGQPDSHADVFGCPACIQKDRDDAERELGNLQSRIDTQQARIAELEGKVEVAQAGYAAAVSKSEWQSRTNGELNQSLSRIADLEQCLAALETWTEEDKPLPEDADIEAAHPLSTGRHDIYAEATRIVGAKRSKFALISVVNWLLARADAAEQDAARYRWLREQASIVSATESGLRWEWEHGDYGEPDYSLDKFIDAAMK